MGRGAEEERLTVVGKLLLDRLSLSKLLLLMRKFRDVVELAHTLLFRERLNEVEVKRRLSSVLFNAWYSSSAIKVAKLYREQLRIKLRKPLLYSVGAKLEKGNRNIRLVSTDRVLIKVPHADGKHEWIEARVRFGAKYIPLIQELTAGNYTYGAGVTIKMRKKSDDWRRSLSKLYLYVNVPESLYLKYFRKPVKCEGREFAAGFDFNVDRINMVVIDGYGKIKDVKNIHFPEVVNLPKEKAEAVRREALAKLVKYASEHGVKYFVIEALSRPRDISGNVGRWAVEEYIKQVKTLMKKVGGTLVEVNPAYSSIEAMAIADKLGLDIHTTSAYIIALRGLKNHKQPSNKSLLHYPKLNTGATLLLTA